VKRREPAPIAQRWSESDQGDDTDRRIGALLAGVPDPGRLPAARLQAVADRLPRRRLPTSRRAPGLRWAVAAALLLGSGGAVFARKEIARVWNEVTHAAPAPATEPPPARPRIRGQRPASSATPASGPATPASGPAAPVADPAPAVDPAAPAVDPAAPATDPVSAATDPASAPVPASPVARSAGGAPGIPRHVPRPRALAANAAPPPAGGAATGEPLPVPSPPPELVPPPVSPPPLPAPADTAGAPALQPRPPAPPPSALHEEAALLRGAIERLRARGRPDLALAELAAHRARFQAGALAADAQLLRVEALLALGRRREALLALDDPSLAPARAGNGRALAVARAELLADGSCAQAIAAFDDLLDDPAASSDTAERALRGRAVCRDRDGDVAAATRDWQRYLARFPAGRFAREARARLGR
jgi:hypothetical protein